MGNQETKLRSGATELGRTYEQRIAALLSIKCTMDPNIENFWILSNVDGVGAFDDIILWINDVDHNKKLYCIQLKHIENKAMKIKDLSEDGKFPLNKYEESYVEISKNIGLIDILMDITVDQIYVILYTNAPLTGNKTDTIVLKHRSGIDLLNTSQKPNNVFQVFNTDTSKNPFKENFLQQFYLFASQASAPDIDKLIKSEFYSHFQDMGDNVLINTIDFFAKWSLGKKGKITKIFKKDVQRMLLEFLLLPYTMEPSEVTAKGDLILDLINDTLIHFNVTAVTRENLGRNIFASIKSLLEKLCGTSLDFKSSWNTHLTTDQTNNLMGADDHHGKQLVKKFLQRKQRYVPYLTVKDLYFAAWQCKLVPLVINCNIYQNSVEKILLKFEEVTKDLSFVLLNPANVDDLKGNLKVFSNITDIQDDNLLIRNLENSCVSLQGKSDVKLKDFGANRNILEKITPDVYMILMEGVVQVGERHEIEEYYIRRDLQRPLLSMDVLKGEQSTPDQEGNIFVLTEFAGGIPYGYNTYTMNLEEYFINLVQSSVDEGVYILTTNFSHGDETLKQVVDKTRLITKKSIHVLRVQYGNLEWLFSDGSVESFQEYLLDSEDQICIPEDDIIRHYTSKTNIISNNAGMGKTFMLHSLANKFGADHWVSYINLSDHLSAISGASLTDIVKHVLDYEVKSVDKILYEFCKKIFVHCFATNNMVWLLDGYDEVSTQNVLPFLKDLKGTSLTTWITTRPTYKRELEIEMGSLSIQLINFSKDDHISFLWKYFETFNHIYNYSKVQVSYIVNTIDKVSRNLDKSFITIPLQTRMFAEIFGDDINLISEKEQFTLVDLYNKFVNIKLKEYKSYEAASLKKTLSKLALKIFFEEDQLDDLLDFEELAEEALTFQESYKKDSIVIGLNEKGDAVFGHRTFAEFLAAHWLAKQIVTNKGQCNLSWAPLIEKLYYIEMLPVRAFFDRIVSQDIPLHIAVLNNDLENVQQHLENEPAEKKIDKLGRSALHLAVSYGRYYDLYVASEVKGLRNIGLHSIVADNGDSCQLKVPQTERSQNQVSTEIVEMLIRHGFSNDTDELFGYDAFNYAMKSCSLDAVNILLGKFENRSLPWDSRYNFQIFVYVIAYYNLYRIFSERKVYDFDESYASQPKENKLRHMFNEGNFGLLQKKYNDAYLTEIAALTGSKEVIYELLRSGAVEANMGCPVHRACVNGHVGVVDILQKMGADLTKIEEHGWSPLYQSGRQGRTDVTYQYLKDDKFRSRLLKTKTTLMTPLHYACQNHQPECAKLLTEHGADILQKDAFGISPLIYANLYGYASLISLLLKGIPAEELHCGKDIQSALNVAASRGYDDCVKNLLKFGLNANNIDDDGNTPLILASQNGFPKVIIELELSQRCDLNLAKTNETLDSTLCSSLKNQHNILQTKLLSLGGDRKALGSVTALHLAIRQGQLDCAQTLVDLGADITIADTISAIGCRPIIWASMYGHEEIIKVLLAKKSGTEYTQEDVCDIDLALMWTATLGYHKCTKVLLECIQDTESVSCEDDKVTAKHLDRVNKMIFANFGPDTRDIDYSSENVVMILAVKNGHASVVQELVSKKCKYSEGLNSDLMRWAVRGGDVACVKLLVELGVDQNEKCTKGLQILPISWACMYGITNVVEYFLKDKTDSYLENKDLPVALNWAALGGFHDIVKLLLDFGLDINNIYEDLNGCTPLIAACEHRGTVEVVDELLARNCIVNITNNDGLSALDFAVRRRQFNIVKRLITSEAYKDVKIDETNSPLYQSLQAALDWAVDAKDNELVHSIVQLGVTSGISQDIVAD